MSTPLFRLAVVFATVTAGVAFVLAAVGWEVFRGSPFGRMLGGLAAITLVLAAYHGLLIVADRPAVPILESVAFTALLAWVAVMIGLHRRMARKGVS